MASCFTFAFCLKRLLQQKVLKNAEQYRKPNMKESVLLTLIILDRGKCALMLRHTSEVLRKAKRKRQFCDCQHLHNDNKARRGNSITAQAGSNDH